MRTSYRRTLLVADDFEAKANTTDQADESDEADVSKDDDADEPESRRRQDAAEIAESVDDSTIVDAHGRNVAECRDEFKRHDSVKRQVAA